MSALILSGDDGKKSLGFFCFRGRLVAFNFKGISMRPCVLLSFTALSLALSSLSYAQTAFKQPTDDELKMTSDPSAPGADAVYLDLEENQNDPLHYETVYARIKVLTEKGKDLATVELPYRRGNYKISDVKARTIHADGTIVPLTGKPEDLLVSKNADREIGKKVFNMPSVEVGSILEYRYQIDYTDEGYRSPRWEIQGDYFIHKAHYQFTPFPNFMPGNHPATTRYLIDGKGRSINSLSWWSKLPGKASVVQDPRGFYSVDVADVPAIPKEDWMPPIDSYLYRAFFYYNYTSNAGEFWQSEGKEWSKEVDKFAEQSKTIHEAVAGLVTPADSQEQRARKLYAAVQALDNTDYSRRKTESELKQLKQKEAKHAEDTWKQKSGDSEDLALLYLAMVRAAGLQAYAWKVVSRAQGIFDASYMSLGQLDDTIVALSIEGKPVLVDPGEKECPFGTLSWTHSGAGGLLQSSQGPLYGETPPQPFTANVVKREGILELDSQGQISGTVRITSTGQESLRWRQRALEVDQTELKKQYDKSLESITPEGVEAHLDHFLGLNEPDSILMAVVNVKGTLGTLTSKRLLLPAMFFETRRGANFVGSEKRLTPVDMHYAQREDEQITYHLPEGLAVEGAPKDAQVSWQGHAAFGTKTVQSPGTIIIARQIARAFAIAKPEEYQDLRGFYQKVATADQQQLVLTTQSNAAQPAKGN